MPKAVLVAAPHTSNLDGFNMLAAAGYYRVKLHWMGKQELIDGPFGWFLKRIGCIPVDPELGINVHSREAKTKALLFPSCACFLCADAQLEPL